MYVMLCIIYYHIYNAEGILWQIPELLLCDPCGDNCVGLIGDTGINESIKK